MVCQEVESVRLGWLCLLWFQCAGYAICHLALRHHELRGILEEDKCLSKDFINDVYYDVDLMEAKRNPSVYLLISTSPKENNLNCIISYIPRHNAHVSGSCSNPKGPVDQWKRHCKTGGVLISTCPKGSSKRLYSVAKDVTGSSIPRYLILPGK